MNKGKEFLAKGRRVWQILRHDSDAVFELRQLVFAVVIALVLVYGLFLLQVEGKQQERTQKRTYRAELSTAQSGDRLAALLSSQLGQLQQKKAEMEKHLALLRFQEKILREQYGWVGSGESFANVIFTLLPLSPVDIENGFIQMNVLDTRPFEHYDIYPVRLQGDLDYSEFLYYLQYLEKQSEVGIIDEIHLELSDPGPQEESVKTHFDLVLGRIQLHP